MSLLSQGLGSRLDADHGPYGRQTPLRFQQIKPLYLTRSKLDAESQTRRGHSKIPKNGPIQVVVVGQVAPPNTEFRDRLLVDLLQV